MEVGSRQRKMMSIGIVWIPAIAGVLFLMLLLFNNWSWRRALVDYGPVLNNVRKAKSDVTAGYIWWNETMAGTEFADIGKAWILFDKGSGAVEKALGATTTSHWLLSGTEDDQKLAAGLTQLKETIGEFRHNAYRLWNGKKHPEFAAIDDSVVKNLYERIRTEADACDAIIHNKIQYELNSLETVFILLVAFWLAIVSGSSLILLRIWKKRRQAERALLRNDSLLRSTIESTADGILVVDGKGKCTHHNIRFAEMWRIPEKIINTGDDNTLLDFVLDQLVDPQAFLSRVQELYQSSKEDLDMLLFKDGRIFERYSYPLIREGRVAGRVWNFRDITERKRSEEALRESEAMYKTLTETSPDAVTVTDLKGRITFVSRKTCELHGFDNPEEMIGLNAFEFIIPEEHEQAAEGMKITLEKGFVTNRDYTMLRKDKSRFIGGLNAALIQDAHGQPKAFIATVRDITEQRRSEQELRDSWQTAADIMASIPSSLFIYRYEDPDRLILLDGNREAEMSTGVHIDQWRGKEFDEMWPEAKESGITEAFLNVVKTGKTYIKEDLRYKDNHIEAAFRIRAFRMTKNRLGIAFENVTERIQAYEALRESEEKYRSLYKHMPVMLYSLDSEGRFIDVSNYWLASLGFDRKELIGKKWTSLLTPESRPAVENEIATQLSERGRCENIPCRFIRKDGTVMDVLLFALAQYDKEGKIARCLVALSDIDRSKTRSKKSRGHFRAIEQSPYTIMIIDPDSLVEYVNPRFTEVTGYSSGEVIGKKFPAPAMANRNDDTFDLIRKAVSVGETWRGCLQNRRKNGQIYWERISVSPIVDDSGQTDSYLIIGEEITNQVTDHQKPAESGKFSAIGLLAAGVAHEFKNHLCGIIGNATLMLEDENEMQDAQKVKEALSSIVDIGGRASDLASSLLTYSKADPGHFQLGDLRSIVDRTMSMVGKEMEKLAIEILTHFEKIPGINISVGKIQQLVLNLLTNALQAVESNGFIMISLLHRGDYIYLKVGDSGCGIPHNILRKVFDPFFSTKGVWGTDSGLGTGMGLTICRNIAEEHKGELSIESIVGAGTIMTLALPIDAGKKDFPPPQLIPAATILLNTKDKTIVSRYFQQLQKQRASLFVVNDIGQLEAETVLRADLVVCDAADKDECGIKNVISYCTDRHLPIIIVNGGNLDHLPTDLSNKAAACFDGLPDLAEVMRATAKTPAR